MLLATFTKILQNLLTPINIHFSLSQTNFADINVTLSCEGHNQISLISSGKNLFEAPGNILSCLSLCQNN